MRRAAALAASLACVALLAACSPQPAASAKDHADRSSPSASATAQQEELTVESVEFPATLTPEQLGETFVDRLSTWDMAGTTEKNRDAYLASGGSLSVVTNIAAQNAQIFESGMYIDGWERVDSIKGFNEVAVRRNSSVLENWFKTDKSGDARDEEAYERSASLAQPVEVTSHDGDTVDITVSVTEHDNADKNRAATLDPTIAQVDGYKAKFDITFAKVDSTWRISSIDPYNIN